MYSATNPRILRTIHRELPRVVDRFGLLASEELALPQLTQLRLFLRSDLERANRWKLAREVRRALRDEAVRLLLRRRLDGGVGSADIRTSEYEARCLVDLVREQLPDGGGARLVLDVATGRRKLLPADRRRFESGITTLARAVRAQLGRMFGGEATSEFIEAIRRIRHGSNPTDPRSPREEVIARIRRLGDERGADEVRRRENYLSFSAFVVVKAFQAGSSTRSIVEQLARRDRNEHRDADAQLTPEDLRAGQLEFVRALGEIRRALGP